MAYHDARDEEQDGGSGRPAHVAVPGWPEWTIPSACEAGVAANLAALADHVGLVRAALARVAGGAA